MVASVTALGTAAFVAGGAGGGGGGGGGERLVAAVRLAFVEYAAVAALVVLVTRALPARRSVPVAGLLGVAGSTVLLRAGAYDGVLEAAGQSAFLAVGQAGAGALGAALYAARTRRERSVREARRAQRLELARDLHDFVAHDVSGIVALAQAARVVHEARPDQVPALLRRIEEAGVRALGSMDRTVHMLRDDADAAPGGERSAAYGLADVPGVVDRFRSSGSPGTELELALTERQIAAVPRETAATAHRVVVEALTNVRRHAPGAERVRVVLAAADGGLCVSVTDSGRAVAGGGRRHGERHGGGLGLSGLAERVEALGGSLTAGPWDGGWRLRARFPAA
ncbi:hypothetical protein AC230_12200 [Streptomyces caatingaensis]|uniref:histidine kinase n=1 Tax=Streptomyces caatingaensis TaxID=1678637 RepID=A0A0K9XH46_9ACTN|nr:hypothetical protein AC230_12200 [Streptomyces caatingaensis]